MANNFLITGYWGEPHVTAENDRGINAAMFGAGRFVLPVGEQFRAEYIGNNTIRMYDGKLIDNGAAAGIPAGEYIDLLIAEAGQGMKRNDIIVFQYAQDSSTLIESGTFVVIAGAETSGTPTDPALTQEDLLSGKATFEQMAMWRVSVSGSTISAPVKLFTVLETLGVHLTNTSNPHKVTKSQVGLGNVPNVSTNNQTPTFTEASTLENIASEEKMSVLFGKIMKAIASLISHLSNKSNPHGVTASQAGAVPTTRKVNNKALSEDISLSASDVGAAASSHGTHVTYSTTEPVMDGTASVGNAETVARSDHKHPTDTSRAPAYTYSTTDLTAGSSSLTTGKLYIVYE